MKTIHSYDIDTDYRQLHRRFPNHPDAPVIGITGNYADGNLTLGEGYYASVLQAGAIPFIIPPFDDDRLLPALLGTGGLVFLITGGVAYTVGAVLYGLGKKRRYFHSIFHLFVLAGSILHFFCILLYIL